MEKKRRDMHLIAIEEKVTFYLLTYGFNIKRKNIKEKKEVLKVLVRGRVKRENKFPPLRFR